MIRSIIMARVYYATAAEDGGSILLYSWIPGEERAEKLGSYDVPDGYSYFQASLKADAGYVCFALRAARITAVFLWALTPQRRSS